VKTRNSPAAALCLAVVIGAAGVLVGCSSSGADSQNVYNQDPVKLAKDLGLCGAPKAYDATTAVCEFSDGGIVLGTLKNAQEQAGAGDVADFKSGYCVIVGPGYQFMAPAPVLKEHLNVQTFLEHNKKASKHGIC
jgi:hypothetical protein